MMALQLLPILQVIVILCSPGIHGVPVYGTKRYGRSAIVQRPVWNSQPYQQLVRTQRYPVSYYDMYPYTQSYMDDYYYPQESYPMYYPARTSKYEVYQAVMPYYYNDRPVLRPNYYYGYADGVEPVVNMEEEILQDAEREEREEAQPIGQEMYYENEASNDDNLDDVNAAFLQNLIMSQMYNDALADQSEYGQKSNYRDDVYGKWEEYPIDTDREYYQEDEDVKELKSLASNDEKIKLKDEKFSADERRHWFDKGTHPVQKNNHHNWENKRDDSTNSKSNVNDRKRVPVSSVASTESTTRKETRGQKEEVLARPATPARHSFSSQMMNMMSKSDDERKRTPSVYDTIKHMLDMEKSLENKFENIKPSMRKRIISSEDSLTQQLSVLKKEQ